jgi:hypothetical protein
MSSLSVANVWFESTANNRIQYGGSNNITTYVAGIGMITVNTTAVYVNSAIQSANVVYTPKTDNYTLTSTDSGTVISMSNTALKTVTVPASLPVGFRCLVNMINTGNVAIGNAAGVTLNSRTGTYTCSTRYGSLSVLVYAANTVLVDGTLV